MPKGYIVGHIDISDPDAFKLYAEAATKAQQLYGARVLARGGRAEALEGEARQRNVILEFDSFEAARAYYDSPEYQGARQLRADAADGDLLLLEGV
jgi:uncharacterized protein (DUF1330 family)